LSFFLQELQLTQFKNHQQGVFNFSETSNLITGLNGVGKTNLLDAIYLLGSCRSYFSRIDSQSISFGSEFSVVHGQFYHDKHLQKASVSLFENKAKKFFAEGKEVGKVADFFGRFPSVMISPEDLKLVQGGSEERRSFMDGIISLVNKNFLYDLSHAKKLTERRNALFLMASQGHFIDNDLLEIIDEDLVRTSHAISNERTKFLDTFLPILRQKYSSINTEEIPGLKLISPLEGRNYAEILKDNRSADMVAGRTTIGVHKEDLEFILNDKSLKKFGSQGQQKTFVLALKLAQFDFQKTETGTTPILLLDDLFDRLDLFRVDQLVSMVIKPPFGQIFVSDPNKARVEAAFNNHGLETKSIHLE